MTAHPRGTKTGVYRSKLEARIAPSVLAAGGAYETVVLPYQGAPRRYTPDFILRNGIAVEVKGWFRGADRAKMLLVKKQYPGLDLRLVLASPGQRLSKTSKTTQAGWCEQHGFPWAEADVPAAWHRELSNKTSAKIVEEYAKTR